MQEGPSAAPLSEEDQLSLAIALSLEQATMGNGKVCRRRVGREGYRRDGWVGGVGVVTLSNSRCIVWSTPM